MIEALCFFHSEGYVHRDIKPDNFRCDSNDKVYLIDFGTAIKASLNEGRKIEKFKGSLEYASINSHRGYNQTFLDDYESLCYVFINYL